MAFCDELKDSVEDIWENVVTNDFVMQLGDDTLPKVTFDIYFDQDYFYDHVMSSLLLSDYFVFVH